MDNIKVIKDQPDTPPSDTSRRVNVTIPASHFIPDDILCHQIVDIYDSNIIKQHLYNEGQLTNYQIAKICNQSARILTEEPNLIRVKKKTAIIGDIHGQFYDLLNILKDFDLRHDTLVFLGDYVDRGTFSTEVYLYLLSLKIQYPKNLFILRGNHESERMTSYFTFKQECMQKYSLNIYKKFVESFKTLPLAAIVNDAFCCHGGISPHMVTVNDINAIDRAKEVPYDGLFCDLLWSDPNPKFVSKKEYAKNRQRNCSYFYNYKAVKNFLDVNKLKMIIRGHEVQQTGYKSISHEDSLVLTIFSAPNYCDAYGNTGAYIIYDKTLTIIRYDAVEHPFYLPNFSDGINWSFPFICEKIGELYIDLLKIANQNDDRVCKFISSMALMRNDRECINEIDEESTELPCCSLKSLDIDLSYDDAKSSDSVNEKVIDKDDIIEDRSSSCTNEIIKNLDDSELSTVLTNSTVEVDNNKGVLEVKIDNIKKNHKNSK